MYTRQHETIRDGYYGRYGKNGYTLKLHTFCKSIATRRFIVAPEIALPSDYPSTIVTNHSPRDVRDENRAVRKNIARTKRDRKPERFPICRLANNKRRGG